MLEEFELMVILLLFHRLAAKLEKASQKSKLGFRDQLKSTRQTKFAVEEKEVGIFTYLILE